MNSWEAQILEAIAQHHTVLAVDMVKQGFPINYSVKVRDNLGNPQPGFSTLLIETVLAQNLDFARFLLESGINPNAQDSRGNHPALVVAASGNVDLAVLLISHNCNFSERDSAGNTVLHVAASRSQVKMVRFLIETLNFPVVVINKLGQKPVDLCKVVQDQGKTLADIEKIEEIIEYLWKKEEFKKKKLGSFKFMRNQRLCRNLKEGKDDESFPVKILPSKTLSNSMSPLRTRQTIQSYLTGKHESIYRSLQESLQTGRVVKASIRSPTTGCKLPKIKKVPLTSQSNY